MRRRNEDYEFKGPGPKPIVRRLSHLHNGSHLRPRSLFSVLPLVHALSPSFPFFSFFLSLSLSSSRIAAVCPSRFNVSQSWPRTRRIRRRFHLLSPQRWPSSFDISRYRFSRATASRLCEPKLDSIPNPDCFLLARLNCPNECNRLCRCLTYVHIYTRPLVRTYVRSYVKRRRH